VAWAAATPLLAASLAVMFALRHEEPTRAREPLPATVAGFVSLAPIEERTLEDGSVLRLNRGAVVTVHYTATERRLRLKKGEASFKVAEDPARPFVVETTGVAVRAVGTEFNVQLGDRAIDIIVTEGTVALVPASGSTDASPSTVSAGQRALVPIEPAAPRATVSTPPPEELSRRLAWQPRLLTFNDEPLAVILGEFNRHNPVTLRLDDPGLQELRLSARFRSDNVQGFLRLLESEFRVRSHAQGNGEVVLRSAESLRSPKTHQ
jgi:transmembrane sensor